MLLKEKVFIVTGASSGIGEEISKQLSFAGSKVVCAARRLDQLERVCDQINNAGGTSIPVQTDVTALDQCQELVNQTIDVFGRIDAVVLNAGISMWARFEEITDLTFFKDLINVNYLGAVNCVFASLPHLKKTNGKIISCSTGQALMGFPNHSGYSASKHALHGFLSTLAIENKNEITILEAVLGWIRNTELRGNAFGVDGKKHKKPPKQHSKESIDLNQCVGRILLGIKKDWRTVYIPKKLRLIPFFKAFWRWYLEFRVHRAVERPR
tara:strand:- start:368 stop:1171 length:804 start_codon:yes stop_codon:yes gene_type:complete